MIWRWFKRDWRSGELLLIAFSVVVAATMVFSIQLMSSSLQQVLANSSKQFLAADIVLQSSRPVAGIDTLSKNYPQVSFAKKVQFDSVIIADQAMQLAAVNAVSNSYPLRGELSIRQHEQVITTQHGPKRGEIWLNQRLMQLLTVTVNDNIQLGNAWFKVTAILHEEPDQGLQFYGSGNRALIHLSDLPTTGIIQPGSRVKYRYLFAGEKTQLIAVQQTINPQLSVAQNWLTIEETQPQLSKTIERAQRFLKLAASLAIGLAGLAISLSAARYANRHQKHVAILKTLGCSKKRIVGLFSGILLLIAVIAVLLGLAAGYGLYIALLQQLLPVIQTEVNLSFEMQLLAVINTLVICLIAVIVFSLSAIWRLAGTSAISCMRSKLQAARLAPVFMLGLLAMAIIMLLYTGDVRTSLLLLLALTAIALLIGLIAYGLTRIYRVEGSSIQHRLGFVLRSLQRYRLLNISLLIVVTISIMLLMVTYLLSNSLLEDWQQQLPDNAPNYFVLNVSPTERQPLAEFLEQQAVSMQPLYPIVMGRLVAVNDEPVTQRYTPAQRRRAGMERELSLTATNQLPSDNIIHKGIWHSNALPVQDKAVPVSVEQQFAERLDLALGDKLKFSIGSESLTAIVSSLRQLNWQTMQPNFFMIFPEYAFSDFAPNYLSSFYWPENNKQQVVALIKQFPTITLIDINTILASIKKLVSQLATVLQLIFIMVLVSALLVVIASMQASVDARRYEYAIFRAIGADKKVLIQALLGEYFVLGLIAGLLAVFVAEGLMFLLANWLFSIQYDGMPLLWLGVPFFTAALIAGLAYFGCSKVVRVSPVVLLNQS